MFKGKAIYNPSGKAGEYSYWACNFFVGCSNGCTYCYLKKGRGAAILGGDTPTLKKCFKDESHALEVFEKELKANLPELQKYGLFFSFTTDPLLEDTIALTYKSIARCIYYGVPVKILTKRAGFEESVFILRLIYYPFYISAIQKKLISFGFTLTGHDELEPGASTNAERIETMKKLHNLGFKTFASIEPIIDFDSSLSMIRQTLDICNLYKVGLESGKKYDSEKLRFFVGQSMVHAYHHGSKIYFKDSIIKALGISRSDLEYECCSTCLVNRDYNMFESEV